MYFNWKHNLVVTSLICAICSFVVGCSDPSKMSKALNDPITVELVKSGIINDTNACAFGYSLFYSTNRQVYCDALDLRLKKQGYSFGADELIKYYLINSKKQVVEDISNGKNIYY